MKLKVDILEKSFCGVFLKFGRRCHGCLAVFFFVFVSTSHCNKKTYIAVLVGSKVHNFAFGVILSIVCPKSPAAPPKVVQ